MPGLLGSPRGGLLGSSSPRQVRVAPPAPMAQASPSMMMGGAPQGGPPAYGSDDWALQTGGPGAMIMRELARGGAYQALDPKTKTFSPWLRQFLGPQFQRQDKK